jgi:hypothetical protein
MLYLFKLYNVLFVINVSGRKIILLMQLFSKKLTECLKLPRLTVNRAGWHRTVNIKALRYL